jgi:hypothetical protein
VGGRVSDQCFFFITPAIDFAGFPAIPAVRVIVVIAVFLAIFLALTS